MATKRAIDSVIAAQTQKCCAKSVNLMMHLPFQLLAPILLGMFGGMALVNQYGWHPAWFWAGLGLGVLGSAMAVYKVIDSSQRDQAQASQLPDKPTEKP